MGKEIVSDVYRDVPKRVNKTLRLSLPVPISINAMYVNKRGGGKGLSSKAQNYIRDARALINEAMEEQKWSMQSRHTWIYIDMVYYFPDRKVRDSHNCLKLLLDVMQGYVYENDVSVLPRIQSVEYDKLNPRVELCVSVQTENSRSRGIKSTQVVV